MTDSQIALIIMVAAIVGTGIALFRQRMLGIKGLAAVIVATLGIGSFLVITLTAP